MNLTWILIRGSGLVAYALLAATMVWGVTMSAKSLGRGVSAKATTYLHEALSVGALLATVVHMVALVFDDYVEFGIREVLVPGASTWEPTAVAYGVVAFYTLALTTVTFYVRKRIGQQAWRAIHYATYGVFVAALLHGVLAGTDSTGGFAVAFYGGSALIVAAFTVLRVLNAAEKRRRPVTPRASES